ncbi:hypothetical protein FACS1894179_00830 [Bacteroidia bacterium]|nr:hypothetical protein FACS1894179_00830 [Bacteroidia bacterium]
MRNTLTAATLESKFPLLAVEYDCILSKDADITVAYRVELPELFTVTSAEYEAIHAAWAKAIKVLPNYSVILKQDWFTEEDYKPELQKEDISFLSRSFERHFNERPFLNHTCYLFLTKTTKERAKQQSSFTALTRGFIVPKEMQDRETAQKFLESVGQFERIINDSGFIKLSRLTTDEIVGVQSPVNPEGTGAAGIIEKYFSLSQNDTTCLQDMALGAGEMKVGDKYLCLHTLSDADDLPGKVETDTRYERLSTDRSDCRLSFAAPIGVLLTCNHMVNQYIFIDDHAENLKRFERQARNMHSLSRYSRSNQINKQWIEEYLNDAHSFGLTSVRCHVNVMAWSEDKEELSRIKNDVGSQLALMGCKPRHNTVDTPTLFWAGIPGNQGDFPGEESFYTFIKQALCFFVEETNYKSSPSPFGIKMVDRVTGKPLHVDISDLPMKKGIISNRNKFVLGPSGSGKSFFMNHMVRQYWEQGTHVVLVDTGNSYQGLCEMIRNKTKGEDGIYFTYTEKKPISFNPFYTDDGQFDVEKKDSLKTLLLTLWKSEDDKITKTESGELGSAVDEYITKILTDSSIVPSFNTFYEFMRDEYKAALKEREIEVSREDFNIDNLLTTLRQYYRGGRFDFLLNSDKELDLLNKRFIVFEIDAIKENRDLFPVVTIIIMEAFINKLRHLEGVRKQFICEEAWL